MNNFDLPSGKENPNSVSRGRRMPDDVRQMALQRLEESRDSFNKAQTEVLVMRLNAMGTQLKQRWNDGQEDPQLLEKFNATFADILRIDNRRGYRILQAAKLLDNRGNFLRRPFGAFALSFDGEAILVERVRTPVERAPILETRPVAEKPSRDAREKAPVKNTAPGIEKLRGDADRMIAELRTDVEKILPPKNNKAYTGMKAELDGFMEQFSSVINDCIDIIAKHPEGWAELDRDAGKFNPLDFQMKDPQQGVALIRAYALNRSRGPDARALLVEIADYLDAKFPAKRKPKK